MLQCRRLSSAPLHLQVYYLPVYVIKPRWKPARDMTSEPWRQLWIRRLWLAFCYQCNQLTTYAPLEISAQTFHSKLKTMFSQGSYPDIQVSAQVFPSWKHCFFQRSYPDTSSFPNISRRSKFQAPSTVAIRLSAWLLIWPQTRTNSVGRPFGFDAWPSMFTIPLDTIGLL